MKIISTVLGALHFTPVWILGLLTPEDGEPQIGHVLRRESPVPDTEHMRHRLQHLILKANNKI